MEQNALISVIIPVYAVEPYLDRCIRSVTGQTYNNLQILLVDDGSPDNCPAMCDAWAEKDRRIRVIHKENGGLSDARNAGLAIAEGEYVSFVDSDDWLDLRFYEVLHRTAMENDCQIAECGYITTAEDNQGLREVGETAVYTTEEAMELHLRDRLFRQVVWNKLYRADVITAAFEKGKCHEDVFWTYQIIANCQRLAHVDAPLYFYFQREGSIMGQKYSLKRLDAVEAAVQRYKYVMTHFPELAGLARLKTVSNCMYHHQLLLKTPGIDKEGIYKRWIHRQVCQDNDITKFDSEISLIQQLWLRSYLRMPDIVCKIRNFCHIGF